MEILMTDIEETHGGFSCTKIEHLSDTQLTELEQQLSEGVRSVSWANTEEHRHLVVSWSGGRITKMTDAEKQKVVQILNSDDFKTVPSTTKPRTRNSDAAGKSNARTRDIQEQNIMHALPSILAANLTPKQKVLSRTDKKFTHPDLPGQCSISYSADKYYLNCQGERFELEIFEDHCYPNDIRPVPALEYTKFKFIEP